MAPTFSIILPLYKQVGHAEQLYNTYTQHLDTLNDTWELIFVVNGANDGAVEKLNSINTRDNVRVCWLEKGGWGRAVKYGLAEGKGKYLCYTNSARTDIDDLILILNYARVNNDNVVKATRIIREKLVRKVGSTLYNFECRLLYKVPIWDVNGTPKVIPRHVYSELDITSDDDLIDAEIIIKCVRKGVRIIEIPVVLTARISGSSTTNFASAYKMYSGLLRFKK